MYSRSMSDDEIDTLADEFRYTQSDLIGAGNIQLAMEKYIKPMLNIKLQ